jgi:hypothetical protein
MFGYMFRIATFGESHGKAIGVVVDGVPAGLSISEDDIERELALRRPGGYLVSTRRESDRVEILSGVFNGKTIGSPIAMIIRNVDVVSKPYEDLKYTPRPGHADLPYIMKYGFENWDYFVSWTSGTPDQYPESWWWMNHGENVMALTYEDMNCEAAGNYDSTAYALVLGVCEYIGLDLSQIQNEASMPDSYYLLQNYPNPFNSTTTLRLESG